MTVKGSIVITILTDVDVQTQQESRTDDETARHAADVRTFGVERAEGNRLIVTVPPRPAKLGSRGHTYQSLFAVARTVNLPAGADQ